ncbi:MAG: hypothetical protein ACKOE6_02240 [Flammeovirgaceae bacterium]
MKTENEPLSPQQSLDLIASMIHQAKGNLRDNSFYFLFWGWVIVACNLAVYILLELKFQAPYVVWIAVLPAWLYTYYYGARQARTNKSSTHLVKVNAVMWACFGAFATTLPFLGSFVNFNINPLILMVGSLFTFTSGYLIRFKPLCVGAVLIFATGIAAFFFDHQAQVLFAAGGIGCGYLIPGYLLRSQKDV